LRKLHLGIPRSFKLLKCVHCVNCFEHLFLGHFLSAFERWLDHVHNFAGLDDSRLALALRLGLLHHRISRPSHLCNAFNSVLVLVALSYSLEVFYHGFLFKELVLLYLLHLISRRCIRIIWHVWFLRAVLGVISIVNKVRCQISSMIWVYTCYSWTSWGFKSSVWCIIKLSPNIFTIFPLIINIALLLLLPL